MRVAFSQEMLIVGGGIGGLAAALACHRAGWRARIFERAGAFTEVGAGLQLGPNATRVLHAWGLSDALGSVASFPQDITIRDAMRGRLLGRMRLGADVATRYGAPYATLHRADLHALLLDAVQRSGEAVLHLAAEAGPVRLQPDLVALTRRIGGRAAECQGECEGEALVVADGLWSRLREEVVANDPPPRATGHFAWRCLIDRQALPLALRKATAGVTVCLGARLHVVAYPVRRGELLNLVVLAEGRPGMSGDAAAEDWNAVASSDEVARLLQGADSGLQGLAEAAPSWRRWMLHDREPVAGPQALARGRIALLGDAAHPMLPYLAQGAAMAIEDAAELQRTLSMDIEDVQASLARYARHRWQRVGQVQARARRQANIFHATGPMRWGRDAALKLLGHRLLDQPWLWAG